MEFLYLPTSMMKNNNMRNMKNILFLKKTILLFFVMLLYSCVPKKEIIYYQNIDSINQKDRTNSYEIKIQPDDLLSIIISADNPEAVIPFNLGASEEDSSGKQSSASYLVDVNGFVDFPVIGKLKVSGLTRTETLKLFQDKLAVYIKNPVVIIRILNFKISIQGEVNESGVYPINTERVTLIEALTMAKDLTIYGKRDNILIIREIDGVKSYNRINITNADFINSPFYYLAQNDVVYVEPNKNKVNGAGVGPSTGLIFSITSILITLATLVISTSK